MNERIRVLGLTAEPPFGAGEFAKTAALYPALGRRFNIVSLLRPTVPRADRILSRLARIHPAVRSASGRLGFHSWQFRRYTAAVERSLHPWDGAYELILANQAQVLLPPGSNYRERFYAIYTDNTVALTERYYPEWLSPRGRDRRLIREAETDILRQAAFVFPMSEFARRSIIDDYGCDPQRTIAVGAGANVFLQSLPGPKRYGSRIALFVGTNFEIKGGEVLLDAWERVRKLLPGARLYIVGPRRALGSNQPGIEWLGRIGDREVLQDLYTRAAAFVLPSLFEAWGLAFLEAMGHGLPCIGTNRCAMPEIIEDGTTGLLVEAGNAEALACALATLLGEPERSESMGRAGHSMVLQKHTWDHVVDRMAPSIEAMAAAGPSIAARA
jgi:glycosyltransferase involved in cell wall biosynthesis